MRSRLWNSQVAEFCVRYKQFVTEVKHSIIDNTWVTNPIRLPSVDRPTYFFRSSGADQTDIGSFCSGVRAKFSLKDSYHCEMGMRETVRCRPTLAYRVHFDSLNISDWTDYKILLNAKLAQCCFNVRPTSATWPTINQHSVSVPCWLGKLSLLICCESTVSRPPW